jgi:site-specific recombinase XerD
MKRRELDPWIEGYLDYLGDVRRMNRRTIADVRCTLKKVSTFMSTHAPSRPLWKLSLDDYVAWLGQERDQGSSANAMAKQLSHLRGLLDYSWRSGRADRNVLDGFSLQVALDNNGALALWFCCSTGAGFVRPSCARSTFKTWTSRGMRFSSSTARATGREEFRCRVVWTELLAYLAERGGKRGPLFRTEARKKRISQKEVGQIVKSAATRAGIVGLVTAKTLRHTFATHLMDRGVDLAVIASLMKHRTPAETGVYLHVLPGKTEAAVRSLSDD